MTTRPAYFDTALGLLAHEGRNGLRIGRLCAALGVTSGSFYHHFAGWDAFVSSLLEHWRAEETGRVVQLAVAHPDPLERVRLLKHLVLTVPHEAETAIRAWATVDATVATAQEEVDAGRRRALEGVLAELVGDADLGARLATTGLALLAGHQQVAGSAPVDLEAVLDQFELLVRAHATGSWDPRPSEDTPWAGAPAPTSRQEG